MSEERRLAEQEVLEIATDLRDLRWTWRRVEVADIGQRFGWTQLREGFRSVKFDTGLFPATAKVDVDKDDKVVMISVPVCTYIDPGNAAGRESLQDIFAQAVATISRSFGEPDKRLPGEFPQVRWRDETSTVGVTLSSVVVVVFISPNTFLDRLDRYERGG